MKAAFTMVVLGGLLCSCSKSNQTTPQPSASSEAPAYLQLLYGKQARIADDRFATLTRSLESAPYLKDLKKLFPRASLNYRYFTTTDEPGYNVKTVVNNRYILAMQLPVSFSSDNKSILAFGKPAFYLNEITKVHVEEGQYRGHSSGDSFKFSDDAWSRIAKSNGDFSAADIKLRTNDPVENIEYLWQDIDDMMSTSNAGITSDWKPVRKTP